MTTSPLASAHPRTVLHGRAVIGSGILPDAAVAVEGAALTYAGPVEEFEPRPGDLVMELSAGEVLVPGLVDLHCHGGYGVDFSGADAADARRGIDALHAAGTTTFLASLVTAAPDTLLEQLGMLADLAEEGLIAGMHLEGPFLAEARCGAQDPRWLLDPDPVMAQKFIAAARGHLRTMTYAPERAGADGLIELLGSNGVIPSLGHTACSPAQAAQALARSRQALARFRLVEGPARPTVTHMFNAMDPLHHRAPGALSSCLRAAKAGTAVVELIADNVHLDPALVLTMFELLGAENIALVTDSMAAAGLSDGNYRLGPAAVTVLEGTARVTATGAIAGGTASMLDLVRNSVRAGVSLADAMTSAARVPAQVLGIERQVGQLISGAAADLLVLNGADLELRGVLRHGEWVYPLAP